VYSKRNGESLSMKWQQRKQTAGLSCY